MSLSLRLAWIAGLAPLVAGTGIFVTWLFLRAGILVLAGLLTIYAGLGCVAVALLCLTIHLWRSWRASKVPRKQLLRQAIALIGLVLLNFAAAAGFAYAAIVIEASCNLSITNEASEPLRDVRVSVGEFGVDFGEIPSGRTKREIFWIRGEGELMLTATRDGHQIAAEVDGYVSFDQGGNWKVTVSPSGEVTTEKQ